MARRGVRYIGIDPGLSYTGICIATKVRSGKLLVEHFEVIRTSPKQTLEERFGHINQRISTLIGEYDVKRVVCEAFEVQTYRPPLKAATAMNMLIASISESIYHLNRPFLLSSPRNKRGYTLETLPEFVAKMVLELPKTHRDHVLDAYIHLNYQVCKKGN